MADAGKMNINEAIVLEGPPMWEALARETALIDALADEEEKIIRHALLGSVFDSMSAYWVHLREYEYAQKRREIEKRGVTFVPLTKGSAVKARWSRIFAKAVDAQTKQRIRYDTFKWHIYSFDAAPALRCDEARRAFDARAKTAVFAFYQQSDGAFLIEHAELLRSEDFDLDHDIYIFDARGAWTYVFTHESDCGPYFAAAAPR